MLRTPALLALSLLAVPACAADLSLAVTGGTLGVGPEVGLRISDTFGLRGNATFLSVSHHFGSSDLDYDGRLKLRSGGAMLDLFPFGGGFRLSAGGRYNGNRARVVATPTGNASVGGQTFTPAQIGTLTGNGKVKTLAPTATLGWGGKPGKGFLFGFEAGALFQGRARVSDFTSSTGLIPQPRIDAERLDIQHDVDKFKVYPLVQVALGWRF